MLYHALSAINDKPQTTLLSLTGDLQPDPIYKWENSLNNIPTPYPEINALLTQLYTGMRAIVGEHFVAMYLDGSLASGAFDQDSDIDFIVVNDISVTGDLFCSLQEMHDHLNRSDSPWAIQLEGFYISLEGIRRHDPERALHANIERGLGERLKMVRLDQTWDVHRSILRQQGITLEGPAPQTLIDPVTPAQLQQAMLANLSGWAARLLENPLQMTFRGYQSFIVLTLCRVLYTLQNGEVSSKLAAVRWAKETLGERWEPLIDSAWEGRSHSNGDASPEDIAGTQEFIRYAVDYGRVWLPK